MMRSRRRPLALKHLEATGDWIASRQESDGALPWVPNGKFDPWDHVHAAMGLTLAGRFDAARAAFRYLVRAQGADGAWAAESCGGQVVDATRQSNHAAYLAVGLWHHHTAKPDVDFLAEMWPSLQRAIDFVVDLRMPCGSIAWAVNPAGRPWKAPLLTGSSSIHGSLVCAIRIAERLDRDASEWRAARERLAHVLRHDLRRFDDVDLPNGGPGRHSMDWYYPILGGAVRGAAARLRLLDRAQADVFLEEGVGCRCVIERPWYTVAETCEMVLALDACGLTNRAEQMLSWVKPLRTEEGGYWTGVTHPDRILYPEGEQTPWTAATVLLAADALARESATSSFFRDLAGEDLGEALAENVAKPVARAEREDRTELEREEISASAEATP